MGKYTDNLFKRRKMKMEDGRTIKVPDNRAAQRLFDDLDEETQGPPPKLVECYIKRDGTVYEGHRTHADIRRAIGDEDPYKSKRRDVEGYVDSNGNLLNRYQASVVGEAAGQCRGGVELLSCDVNW